MNELEKLRVIIPHWIEHNEEHAEELRRWAEQGENAAPEILAAAETMLQVNTFLKEAVEKLGGPLHTHHYTY